MILPLLKVTKTVVQYHPDHVTYASAKLEVVSLGGLGGYAFTRIYII